VAAFLAGALPFLGNVDTVAEVVSRFETEGEPTLEAVLAAEARAREAARALTGHPGTGAMAGT
jgi:1-deoxy-D-xylulose 5-phosphate reductoisomerase